MPIIKPARKKKHKYKNGTNTQTLNKQRGNKNAIFQEEICKIIEAKPLHSE
jgi:hypothetical protein